MLGEFTSAVLEEADVLMVWRDPALDEATLMRFERLRAVVRIGVGVDSVDMGAAAALGVAVCNVPAYGTEEVADSTLAHILNLYRCALPCPSRGPSARA